ncbi:acetate kinase [Actinoalloteichus cyanogriseus DSM 43889]|uniref:Acetate kinase n=1 Tax=Actinoalloteichus caeruleus DSM 43889 TaxID=1120930 RepID=A0ABT1JNN9_ACTCY|nr:acetate kinase [Actinoalloteichus caeruleus DSM 43889]
MAVVGVTRVLTVNAGSSSLQLHLVELPEPRVVDSAAVERPPGSAEAERELDDFLSRTDPSGVAGVGHRLVHGGREVRAPTLVDRSSVASVRAAAGLAPSHVPAALRLVDTLLSRLPDHPHVWCPDTAFHAELSEVATTYPLPAEWTRRYGLRRYGFHGLSYGWALRRATALLGDLGRPADQLLLTHLGGGCSVSAVRDGRSVDTSMGMTPLEGMPMTTRSGSVDPGLLLWLTSRDGAGLSWEDLDEALRRRSGLLGLSDGLSADTRDLVRAAGAGDATAALALDVFARGVSRELAAAATSLDRVDALVFTGEIGWDQPEVRAAVCRRLNVLGVEEPVVGDRAEDGLVSAGDASVPVLVVEPREELGIAVDTAGVVGGLSSR